MLNLRCEFHKLSTSINFAQRNGVIKLAEIEIYVFSFYLFMSLFLLWSDFLFYFSQMAVGFCSMSAVDGHA